MLALAEVHLDEDAVKSCDDWHFDLLKKVYHLFDEIFSVGLVGRQNENGLRRNVRETVFVFCSKNLTGLRRGVFNFGLRVDTSHD